MTDLSRWLLTALLVACVSITLAYATPATDNSPPFALPTQHNSSVVVLSTEPAPDGPATQGGYWKCPLVAEQQPEQLRHSARLHAVNNGQSRARGTVGRTLPSGARKLNCP